MEKKEHFVSLRDELPSVLWVGVPLHPEVDIQFRLEPFCDGCRLIKVRLCKGPQSVTLVTGASFTMSDLGKDCGRLETIGADLVAITRCITKIAANLESRGDMLLHVTIMGEEQLFRLYANEPGRPGVNRFEWFMDPSLPTHDQLPIHVPRPVSEFQRQAAA